MATTATAPTRDFTFFLEIIDAFKLSGSSSTSDVVKKDVEGNIAKLRTASAKHGATTLVEVLDAEGRDATLAKLIKSERGAGASSGTVALLWMKRTMQFVIGLLRLLVDDSHISLSAASRQAYSASLRYCHNFVTRGVFDTGLRFVPTRENFYKNLARGGEVERVDAALAEFLAVFEPQLEGLVAMYSERGLEPYIK